MKGAEKKLSPQEVFSWKELEDQHVPVPDSWFKGYLEGNTLWPQTTLGFCLLSFAAIMSNRPKNAQQLLASQLTPEQLNRLGHIMSALHHHQGIPRASEAYLQEGDRVVEATRLQDLWRFAKAYSANALYEHNYGRVGPFTPGDAFTRRNLEQLDYLLSRNNARSLENLQAYMDFVWTIFFSEEAKTLATLYRYKFNGHLDANEILNRAEVYAQKRNRTIDSVGNGQLGEFYSLLGEKLALRFPGQSFSWLIPRFL